MGSEPQSPLYPLKVETVVVEVLGVVKGVLWLLLEMGMLVQVEALPELQDVPFEFSRKQMYLPLHALCIPELQLKITLQTMRE
jgi:hypothetical protein